MNQILDHVIGKIERVTGRPAQRKGKTAQCSCPAHEDSVPSLTVSIGANGAIILHCFAGCATEAVLKAAGLTFADLSDNPQSTTQGQIVATYSYVNAADILLFQVVRFEPKDFRMRRPDGAGGWTWNLNGVARVLYKLPAVIAAVGRGETIYITEGEKDADSLHVIGLTGTCNPGGCRKWKYVDDSALHGRRVAIIADADAPGRKHAQDVAARLHGKAADVRVFEMPDGAKDASDWIESKDSLGPDDLARALQEMAEHAPVWTPEKAGQSVAIEDDAEGDVRLGAVFVSAYADRVRYCPDRESWLVWDRRRWAWDETHGTERLFQELTRARLKAAADIGDSKAREAEAKFWVSAMREPRVRAGLVMARSNPTIILRLADLDHDPTLLNTLSGTVNLRTGQVQPHRPTDLLSKLCPVEYHPDGNDTEWNGFLDRVLPDVELRDFLRRAVGYSIFGAGRDEVLFFICGPTATGKSTFLAAVHGALGDYAATANFETFLQERDTGGNRPRSDLVRLAGRRFVSSIETDEGATLAGGLLKWISGQDALCVRNLYKGEIEFLPTCALWLVSNFRPRANDQDSALWRRLLLVPFEAEIPPAEQDASIKQRLRDPAIGGPAVLRWIVQGALEYQEHGLKPPEKVAVATRAWRAENDPLQDWLAERCRLASTETTAFADLFADYKTWADQAGLRPNSRVTRKKLAERLQAIGCRPARNRTTRFYEGIALRVTGVTDQGLFQ